MIKNVCNALRRVFSCEEGDCISNASMSPKNASKELESDCKEVIIPEGVSEPVISFVKCFQKNPKRFRIKPVTPVEVKIKDKVADINYTCYLQGREHLVVSCLHLEDGEILEFTNEEGRFLISSLYGSFASRPKRYSQLVSQRKQRSQKRLREKLTNIYKEDNNASDK